MKSLLPFLVLLLASCASLTPPAVPVPPVKERTPCPEEEAALRKSSCVAVQEDPGPIGVMFAWMDRSNKWPKDEDGMVRVKVRFLDGTPRQQLAAWKRFTAIDQLAPGLEVAKAVGNEPSHIRVSFQCRGHWSYLGKQARSRPGEVTLNVELDHMDSSQEWDRVALHEFMHALGIEHEQQHPNHEIPWDEQKVYDHFLRSQGWGKEMVDRQVLRRGTPEDMLTSGFDSGSLMMYPIPAHLTKNGYSVGWNRQLSALDIVLIQSMFPPP